MTDQPTLPEGPEDDAQGQQLGRESELVSDPPHNLGAATHPSAPEITSDQSPQTGDGADHGDSGVSTDPSEDVFARIGFDTSAPIDSSEPLAPESFAQANFPPQDPQAFIQTAPEPESQYQFQYQNPSEQSPKKKSGGAGIPRTGLLVAGIAIGAIIGGVAGAGVSALTIGQLGSGNAGNFARDSITISNAEDATIVSAIAAKATPSVVTLEVISSGGSGTGSGVVIDSDGYIITNNHVVSLDSGRENASIRVFLSDGRIVTGTLIGTDPYADLAVVKIDAEGLQAIEFANSEKLNVGDLTVAIGAPLNLANTVTTGVISALYRGITVGSAEVEDLPENDQPADPDDLWNFEFEQQPQATVSGAITIPVIQTDASINPGNSGGALLNANGDLIGINVAIASTSSSAATAGSVGLGFAIPSNLAKRVAESLIAGEKASHGKLGISVGDASGSADAVQSGALVRDVSAGSPAAQAGLRNGDVVISLNGVPVMDGTSLSGLVRYYPAGTDVELAYIRDGRVNTTNVTLGSL